MVVVLVLAASLYFLAGRMGVSPKGRLLLPGILLLAVFIIQATLPAGNPLKEATGGSMMVWVALAVVAVIVLGYSAVLKRLRARHETIEEAVKVGTFAPAELDRYARHIVLREIGGPGQKKMKNTKVLVIGAGGLGSPALQYLAAAGIGTIGVVDDDIVSNSNLQRQVIHRDDDIGRPKVQSAMDAIKAQNPFVEVRPFQRRLTDEIAADLFADYDLVLDGTDNFDTRYLVNRTCVQTGTPLVSAAITQWEGQISLYNSATDMPCYACVFPQAPETHLAPSCAEAGVVGALPGVVGAMMASEAIKWITGAGETLAGRLMIYDALYAEARVISVKKSDDCSVCGAKANAAE